MSADRPVTGQRAGKVRWLTGVLAAVLALTLHGAGRVHSATGEDDPAARLRQQFLAAGRAYEEGRAPEAVRLYEDLIRSGHPAMEVYFNLGNAHFMDGRPGEPRRSGREGVNLTLGPLLSTIGVWSF